MTFIQDFFGNIYINWTGLFIQFSVKDIIQKIDLSLKTDLLIFAVTYLITISC